MFLLKEATSQKASSLLTDELELLV